MGWKEWPMWVKGGIILFCLSSILGILDFSCLIHKSGFECIPFEIPTLITSPFRGIFLSITYHTTSNSLVQLSQFLVILTSVLLWTIVGAVVGWIVGKVKERRQRKK